eukprot:COSAG01_NODE_39913_length_470_cov_1.326146_1_plen_47_part_10
MYVADDNTLLYKRATAPSTRAARRAWPRDRPPAPLHRTGTLVQDLQP